jgi:beta-phosphoglucomutase-like phosphatase (HAD superfamily)/choline kinase
MNIIIPLGGKGERFSKNGYTQPKPLIQIFDKCIIEYVLDNLLLLHNIKVFIIYNKKLDDYDFSQFINNKYPFIQLITINDTKGATETLFLGIDQILNNYFYYNKCLILDCDTFYTEDVVNIFNDSDESIVFYTTNFDENPIYSYIELNDDYNIINIREKHKISDNANTGAYAFTDINVLYDYCKYVLDNNITFNNEPYISCVISEMIKSNLIFKGYELKEENVFSLGTPNAVNKYIDNTYAFLFDLDGTLVITDEIYYDVWYEILIGYNIILTNEIFKNYIQGNNDKYVLNVLLKNSDLSSSELSKLKDDLFIKNICKIKIIDGIYDIINQIKVLGHKICIVTNCNKNVANEIIKYIKIDHLIDFIISSDDCIHGKPNIEPYEKAIKKYNIDNKKCFIFEDSKSGLLSGKCVNPKLLIGIETIYDNNELKKYCVDLSIKNYCNIDINNLIYNEKNNINYLKNIIKNSSIIDDIKYVLLDENKLKGGFIADVLSFKIITNDNNVYSQILKYENIQENNLSSIAKSLKLYEREYYFYTNISNNINVNIPKFCNLIFDENSNNVGIVLENLFDKNYKNNLNLNLESIDLTLKIIDRMSKMHSKYWNKNLKKMFPELKNSNDKIFCPFFLEFIDKRYELFKNKWSKVLNNYQLKKCDEIYKNFNEIQNSFSNGNNLTFIHGDIKSPNIFYDIKNNNEPYFIDWQHCAIGKGVQDLIFFIIESFDIINIKSVFFLSKEYYYKKILEYGVISYSFEEYENDINDALCYIPFFTSIWFGTIPQDELIDKNFPYFLITKMFYLLELINQSKL